MIPPDAQLGGMPRLEIISALKKRDAEADLLERDNRQLLLEIKELKATVVKLMDELRRKAGAANKFSKGKSKADPKLPGRKPGQGVFKNRSKPEPRAGDVSQSLPAPLDSKDCPNCGRPLEIKTEEATIVDVPPQPTRVITTFTREVGFCPHCGTTHLGSHPQLPADQRGATAHRLGPNVQSLALGLHYGTGLPLRKVPGVIDALTGISMTQSNLTQTALKLTATDAPLDRAWEQLQQELRKAPVVNTDDSSWSIAAIAAYLMCFVSADVVIYQIKNQHRSEEVLEMLGQCFRGLLGTDRGPSYDAHALHFLRMQKCLCHLLKNIKEALEDKDKEDPAQRAAIQFGAELSKLLREAILVWRDYRKRKIGGQELKRKREDLHARLSAHLKPRELEDRDAQRLLDGIGQRHDNGQLLLFLEHPKIEPTNNVAERAIRGAVIARKVSHCSKNKDGANAYAKIKSVVETLKLRGYDWMRKLGEVIATGVVPPASR